MDCSPFLNWNEEKPQPEFDKSVVFRSLIATVKVQPALDGSMEAKAVTFLESVVPDDEESVDAFLRSLGSNTDESLTCFVQSIVVLVSTHNHVISTAAMKMLRILNWNSSAKSRLALVKADLVPQLIPSLNPLSLPFAEAVDIHINLMFTIRKSLWLATPDVLRLLEITDRNEKQAVHETVLQQVVTPSETYISHSCVNRFSIIDGELSTHFLALLASLLEISTSYQPAMDIIVHMPVVLMIPCCVSFFENEAILSSSLYDMNEIQRRWNKTRGYARRMKKTVYRMLRMEGIEDVIAEKLQNDKDEYVGRRIVEQAIKLNNQQGMNNPELW
ncbi:hypothetical protein BLNAU_16211 [Blattamonas nauphoetae]|uniref:Uncharacterized protein n=1 Tax=Blattamonas nauphoetae TaxID=2049346 RepID=A0ABQ9X8S2_9EUKA|nr:hypothetical protein BLNAU_16211 [Blattamonas nauphoetae]